MFEQITTNYAGGDATAEIVFMIAVALFLGYIFRLVWDRYMYEDAYQDYIDLLKSGRIRIVPEVQATQQSTIPVQAPVQETVVREVVHNHNTVVVPEPPAMPVAPQTEQVVTSQSVPVPAASVDLDDLKIIEGVGPKIEQLLKDTGYKNLHDLSQATYEDLRTMLYGAGERYRIHDPTTWPEQAQLAYEGKMDELKEFQAALSGGKDLTRIYKEHKQNPS